jgi:hypothetical protein|tara:strand:- start:5 stop:1201 length:1197 start_codon:yes stop_codon:yes gene_type:complete
MKKKDNIIDVVKIPFPKKFTEEHKAITKRYYNNYWKENYPELYGDGLPEAIKFLKFEIVSRNSLKLGIQKSRGGGKTVQIKYNEIKQNIERNGYKLKHPPISVFHWNHKETDGDRDGYTIITGNTRSQILADYDMENFVVAVYERADDFSDEEVQDALESAGLLFNSIHDPASPISKEDVVRIVTLAIKRYKDTNGEAGIPKDWASISERVNYVCGSGTFQKQTRDFIVTRIYNNANPRSIVIPWGMSKSAEFRVNTFMDRNKWVDTDKVKYLATSTGSIPRSFVRAVEIASKFPKAEVRIVLHTSTLDGYDHEQIYKDRIQKFCAVFQNILQNANKASDTGATFSRIKIYGALPAVGVCHDITVPFYYNARTNEFYQKTNDYVFDAIENEEEIEEAA